MNDIKILESDLNKFKNLDQVIEWFDNTSQHQHAWTAVDSINGSNGVMSKPSCDGEIDGLWNIIGLDGYFEPHGTSICELLSTHYLFRNDLFLLSELSDGIYTSKKIYYQDLSNQLFTDIKNALKVGSMAYEPRYKYAISSHNHDNIYSTVDFTPNMKFYIDKNWSNDRVNDYNYCRSQLSTLGSISISTDYLPDNKRYDNVNHNPKYVEKNIKYYDINTPKVSIPLPPKPMIGTLKFIAAATIKKLIDKNGIIMTSDGLQVNPYNSNNKIRDTYDGWVFPNGISIPNKEKQLSAAAYEIMNDNTGNSNISLPNLADFIRLRPLDLNVINKLRFNNCLLTHTHSIGSFKINAELELDRNRSQISSTNGVEQAYYTHHGSTSTFSKIFKTEVLLKFDDAVLNGLTCNSAGVANDDLQEAHPAYNYLPVMMYIGGETDEFYANQN